MEKGKNENEVKTVGGAWMRVDGGLAEGLALGVRSQWVSDVFLEVKNQQGLLMDRLWRVRGRINVSTWVDGGA